MYGFIDMLFFDVMLNTCNNIEKPPKPNKNAQTIMFVEISLFGIAQTLLTPFVNSMMPEKILSQKLLESPKRLKIGENIVVNKSKK